MSFTKKMPQLTSAELIKFTKQMTTIGSKCCQLGQDKLLPCAEENVSNFFPPHLTPTFSVTIPATSRVQELTVPVNEQKVDSGTELHWWCTTRYTAEVSIMQCHWS